MAVTDSFFNIMLSVIPQDQNVGSKLPTSEFEALNNDLSGSQSCYLTGIKDDPVDINYRIDVDIRIKQRRDFEICYLAVFELHLFIYVAC